MLFDASRSQVVLQSFIGLPLELSEPSNKLIWLTSGKDIFLCFLLFLFEYYKTIAETGFSIFLEE